VNQSTADNYVYIRYADVLLWAAECAAQANDLPTAMGYVNQVRQRAANTAGWVAGSGAYAPYAANYKIGLYASFPDQATALTDIYFERKLELSSEGHRFFDLVRWGIADVELNAYIAHEATADNYLLLKPGGALSHFTKGKNEYYPIPQNQIDASVLGGKKTLTQNPGY
jgi:starch-binding outer membrane protein, SusD/RagB family